VARDRKEQSDNKFKAWKVFSGLGMFKGRPGWQAQPRGLAKQTRTKHMSGTLLSVSQYSTSPPLDGWLHAATIE
jgi:hypothetical protein